MGLRLRRSAAETPAEVVHSDVTAIAEAHARTLVRVRGSVTRMKARPSSGMPSLAVSISDATGSVTAVWTGRRSIGGITLGRHVLIEGVPVQVGERLEFINPAYTLLQH